MKFRPCIDLHEGKVKQIVGETLDSGVTLENFVSDNDSEYFAKLYKKHGLTGGHIIMLGKGNEDEAMKALKAYEGGLQVGGGLNDENYKPYLDAGASHIIVTSYIFTDEELDLERLKKISDKAGKDRLVIDLSCKKHLQSYYVATNKWRDVTSCEVNPANLEKLSRYCDEFLIHASDVEGKREGPDLELIELLAGHLGNSITYAGGVRNKGDIESVNDAGKGRVDLTIGSALDIFGGDINFEEVVSMKEFQ